MLNTDTVRGKLKSEEGVRVWRYFCSMGVPTVGVGFNLKRPDARARIEALGLNFDDVLSRKAALTQSQIDALLDADIADCLADLKHLVAGFDDMPQAAQLVLADMRFQLGPNTIRGFKNTLKAFAARDWKAAAKGLRSSLAYKQTPVRWERNAKMLEALV